MLGDFNIFGVGDATFKALEKQWFYIPEAIREHPTDLRNTKHYDQIAFRLKIEPSMTVFSEGAQRAGASNFSETVYTEQDLGVYREYIVNFGARNFVLFAFSFTINTLFGIIVRNRS